MPLNLVRFEEKLKAALKVKYGNRTLGYSLVSTNEMYPVLPHMIGLRSMLRRLRVSDFSYTSDLPACRATLSQFIDSTKHYAQRGVRQLVEQLRTATNPVFVAFGTSSLAWHREVLRECLTRAIPIIHVPAASRYAHQTETTQPTALFLSAVRTRNGRQRESGAVPVPGLEGYPRWISEDLARVIKPSRPVHLIALIGNSHAMTEDGVPGFVCELGAKAFIQDIRALELHNHVRNGTVATVVGGVKALELFPEAVESFALAIAGDYVDRFEHSHEFVAATDLQIEEW